MASNGDALDPASSFAFLRAHADKCYQQVRRAERYTWQDSRAALMHLRLFAECIVERALAAKRMAVQGIDLVDRIDLLEDTGAPARVIAELNRLRNAGNRAVHLDKRLDDPLAILESAFEVACWFEQLVARSQATASIRAFAPPPRQARREKELEQQNRALERQIRELERRLAAELESTAAVEGAQAPASSGLTQVGAFVGNAIASVGTTGVSAGLGAVGVVLSAASALKSSRGGHAEARLANVPTEFEAPDWVYFATPSKANADATYAFARTYGIICCSAYTRRRDAPQHADNVQNVEPGQIILLAYGKDAQYSGQLLVRVERLEAAPIGKTKCLYELPETLDLHNRLRAAGYGPDPRMGRFTGFAVTPMQHVRRSLIRPSGKLRHTLSRWREVLELQSISP